MPPNTGLEPIRIGILHSLKGSMAISERPLVDAAILAVEEINRNGGILGRRLEAVVSDGSSEPNRFSREAEGLIKNKGVVSLFGCWTSTSRTAVKRVVEDLDSLLWYPIQYEGLEQSPNIVYTGACPNQQVEPFLGWSLSHGARRFFLVGSDYVYPRTTNLLIKSLLEDSGAEVVGEEYFPLICQDYTRLAKLVKKTEPDMIVNTVNGSSNLALFDQLISRRRGKPPYQIGSMSCAEIMYSSVGKAAHGQMACWSFFQTLDTNESKAFINGYRARWGDGRKVSDPIASAYSQVRLWAEIVQAEGTASASELKNRLTGYGLDSPLGRIEIKANNHIARNALVGRYGPNGFDILWQSARPIEPLPWLGLELTRTPRRNLLINILKSLPGDIAARSRLEIEMAERKRVEQALRDNQEQLLAMSEAAYDPIIVIDAADKIIFWNRAAEKLFGYSREEAVGQMMHRLITPEKYHAQAYKGLRKFSENGTGPVMDKVMEFMALCKDGTLVPVERSVASFKMGSDWYAVGSVRDISERKKAEEELRRIASTDELTGINNRRRFMELAGYEIERARRFKLKLCLAMFDVDHFKKINDRFGHDAGDEVLKKLAQTGAKCMRSIDAFGRIGGEEFAIIMPETDLNGCVILAERLMNNLRAVSVPADKGVIRFTVSMGLAPYGCDLSTVDSLLKAADEAMYRAKQGGRDRLEIHTPAKKPAGRRIKPESGERAL